MVDLYINKTQDEQLEDFYFRSSHNHEPLNELTPEEKTDYESRDSWTWIEAIYILNGFKPIFQTSTKPMLLRFSNEISYFSEALALGDIGKKIIKDGAVDYEDTVKHWMEFWRKYEWMDDIVHSAGNCSELAKKNGANLSVDWVHWLMLQEWNKEQAAYLICEIDPNNDYFKKPPEPVTKIIQRCYADLKLDQAPPFEWLRWFDKVGLLDVSGKLTAWYNEQLAEKELAGDLPLDETQTINSSPVQQKENTSLKKRNAIFEIIKEKGFKPLSIPHGGKSAIEVACRNRYGTLLDTADKFKRAWDSGVKDGVFKTENHDKYSQRGKSKAF